MAVSEDLLIKIQADTSGIVKGVDDLNKSMKGMSDSAKSTGSVLSANDKTMQGLAVTITGLNQAFELAKKAIGAVIGPIQDSVKAFIVQDAAERKVANSLKLVGQYSQETMEHFMKFTAELQDNSKFGDEVTLQLVAMSKAMGLSDKQTTKLIQASADLAAITGKDINSAYTELQGTFAGVIGRTTGKLIPALKDLTQEQLKAGAAVDIVGKKFQGFAKADVSTFDGSLTQLNNSWGDLQEMIGKFFVDLLRLPDVFKIAKAAVMELQNVVGFLTGKLALLDKVDWEGIAKSVLILAGAIGTLQLALMAFNAGAAISAIGGISSAIAAMGGTSVILGAITAKLAAFGLALKTAAMSAASFVLPLVGFVAAAAVIDILVRNLERFGEVGKSIEAIFEGLAARITRGLAAMAIGILSAIEALLEVLSKLPGVDNTDLLAGVRGGMSSLGNIMEGSSKQVDEFGMKLQDVSKNLDLGAAGQIFNTINGLMKDSSKEAEATGKSYKDMGGSLENVTRDADKFIGTFRDLNLANVALAQDNALAKGDELGAIQNALNLEMIKFDLKAEEIRLSKDFNDAEKTALLQQIDLAKKLHGEKAKKDSDTSQAGAAGPNMFEGFTKGAEAFKTGSAQFSGSIAGGFTGGLSTFVGGVGMIMGAADALLGMAQKMVDFIPGMLDKVTKLANSARELPERITKSLKGMTKAIERFVAEIVPNFFKGFLDGLDTLFDSMFDGLPKAFEKLISSLPATFEKFADRLPALIKKFIVGFLTSGQKFVDIFINGFIKDSPKMLKRFIKGIPEVVKAIVGGVVEAVKQSLNGIAKNFGFEGIFNTASDALQDGLGKLGKAAAKESAQVFKVLDIEAAARSAKQKTSDIDPRKAGKDIMKWLMEALNKAITFFKRLGQYIWEGLIEPIANWFGDRGTEIWNGFIKPLANWFGDRGTEIWDGFIKPLANWFGDRGTEIWNGFILPIGTWFGDRGTEIWDGFILPVASWFGDRGTEVWNGFLAPIGEWFAQAGAKIWNGFSDLVSGAADALGNLGKGAADAFFNRVAEYPKTIARIGKDAFDGFIERIKDFPNTLANIGKSIFNGFIELMKKFDFGALVGGSGDGSSVVDTILGKSMGGLIPLYASGGAFVPRGTDTVPAMLTPGEFVVNRQATANNLGLLNNINNGGSGAGGSVSNAFNFTINLKIDASSQSLDATFVRNKLIPDIKKELKDSSLRGEFLMSEKGIR